jgi:hypothetical protein
VAGIPDAISIAEVSMRSQLQPNTYRVEVSGWDSSENFFVEKTSLTWGQDAQKQITLKSELREGCMLFVRLLQPLSMVNAVPAAYQAINVAQKDAHGRTRVSLLPSRPRSTESSTENDSGTKAA